MSKKLNRALIAFVAVAVIAAVCVYSFVTYTTPNPFKALYARGCISEKGVYELSEGRYMVSRGSTDEETYGRLVHELDGEGLERASDGLRPYWQLRLEGSTKRIDPLTDGSGYIIVELV
ncbi:MAG: hypothetical protein IJ746_06665 [Ruminococcus sp.]|nr:hypothetical protein [Ruminococcus sp.]